MAAQPNHYAPPAAAPAVIPRRLGHARLKYFYLASLLLPVVLTLLTLGVKELMPLFGVVTMLVLLAGTGCYFLWVYRTWSLLPEQHRRGATPAAAVGYNFIPGYNIWWLFASNLRIASGLAETLGKYRTRVRAPTVLAWIGPALVLFGAVVVLAAAFGSHAPTDGGAPAPPSGLTMLLPFLGFSPFVWFAWMVRVDSCHQEILFQRNEKKARKASRRSVDDAGEPSPANDE